MLKRVSQILMNLILWCGLLFVSAGTLQWPRAWIFVGFMLAGLLLTFIVVRRYNPGIAEARSKMKHGTKAWDKRVMFIFGMLYLVMPIVAGLDAIRFAWSHIPISTVYIGLVFHGAGTLLLAWVLATNPFLETTVRLQNDRGQQVITSGPYQIIRHPMYSGMLIQYLGIPLILGSLWSYAVVAALLLVFIFRTGKEDQMLANELSGYLEYSHRTRYRLMPGIW